MADEIPRTDSAADTPQVVAPAESAVNGHNSDQKDVAMSDAPVDHSASSPAPATHAPSPIPARTGTPAQGSRAASAHPDSGLSLPAEAAPHGDPTRRYLNTKVTGVLLEGVKQLAKDKPSDPLRVLGEYLIQKSKELEGTG
ncbi:histone-lysine n-methyltransferase [Fusarium coicis]|nr:histone-lysine n-methyltransferase [Fusarium coicis]